jgi:hypothetical protein
LTELANVVPPRGRRIVWGRSVERDPIQRKRDGERPLDSPSATEIISRAIEGANVWIALGSLYLKMNRKADALSAVRRAVELNPSNKRKGSGGLPRHPGFEALRADPEWRRIMNP